MGKNTTILDKPMSQVINLDQPPFAWPSAVKIVGRSGAGPASAAVDIYSRLSRNLRRITSSFGQLRRRASRPATHVAPSGRPTLRAGALLEIWPVASTATMASESCRPADLIKIIRALDDTLVTPTLESAKMRLPELALSLTLLLPKLGMSTILLLPLAALTGLPTLSTLLIIGASVVGTVLLTALLLRLLALYHIPQDDQLKQTLMALRRLEQVLANSKVETVAPANVRRWSLTHSLPAEEHEKRVKSLCKTRAEVARRCRQAIEKLTISPIYALGMAISEAKVPVVVALSLVTWLFVNSPPGAWLIRTLEDRGLIWRRLEN